MAKKYLDYDGLLYFWQKIKNLFVTDVTYTSSSRKIQKTKAGATSDVVTLATVATSGSYTDLSNKPTIPTIPNGFANVKVGSTTVAADTTTDTVELVAGSNVTITPDATNDKITIAATDTTVQPTTTTPKMDGTAAVGSETKYAKGDHVHPSDTTKVDKVEGKGLSTNDFTDTLKTKLDGIEAGAEVNQNAFSRIRVISDTGAITDVEADSKTDQLILSAGSNIDFTANATNDSITILAEDTTYAAGTQALIEAGINTVTRVWSAKILHDYVTSVVETAVTGGASFQGTAPSPFAPTNYKSGYYWVVGTAGTYAGQVCEAGDMIFAVADYGTAYSASDFDVVQTNLDITSITNAEIDTIVAS